MFITEDFLACVSRHDGACGPSTSGFSNGCGRHVLSADHRKWFSSAVPAPCRPHRLWLFAAVHLPPPAIPGSGSPADARQHNSSSWPYLRRATHSRAVSALFRQPSICQRAKFCPWAPLKRPG
ncbi:hypothetical protein [Escherichia coli]|uniref:hypothetical protein n=1 Tax=Escherichia coli TaxID=562 RepID=UPI001CDBC36F